MNAYVTSNAARLIAAIIAVGVTLGLFSIVVAPAMQPQVDGSARLAHVALPVQQLTPLTLVARADVPAAR